MACLISIVNYRSAPYTQNCLTFLARERQQFADFHVVIVDNDSQDDSLPALQSFIEENRWCDWVTVEGSPDNSGFAGGNNFAVRCAKQRGIPTELVLLLNPDAQIAPGTLQRLTHHMNAHPKTGVVGCRITNLDGSTLCSAFRLPTALTEFVDATTVGFIHHYLSHHSVLLPHSLCTQRVDWVSGAALMIRGDLLDRLGLMDDNYFLYFEEVDLCLQAARAGYECWYLASASVLHDQGGSTGFKASGRELPPPCWYRSRARFFEKNFGLPYRYLADFSWIAGHLVCSIKNVIKGEKASTRQLGKFLQHWRPRTQFHDPE